MLDLTSAACLTVLLDVKPITERGACLLYFLLRGIR